MSTTTPPAGTLGADPLPVADGTPRPVIRIDDRTVPFRAGQTIMDAALAAGIYIPHLCHNPRFAPHGSCRVCTVRVNGHCRAACTTPATAGDRVENITDDLQDQRRMLVQMLFVEGNHVCPSCEKSGACQLQAVAYFVGMLTPHFRHFFPRRSLDASHPDAIIDHNRCILCELCVRASRDLDHKDIFTISGRGLAAQLLVNAATGRLAETTFSIQDQAAQVCPVGAILPKRGSFQVPIGARRYDRAPISIAVDVAAPREKQGGETGP